MHRADRHSRVGRVRTNASAVSIHRFRSSVVERPPGPTQTQPRNGWPATLNGVTDDRPSGTLARRPPVRRTSESPRTLASTWPAAKIAVPPNVALSRTRTTDRSTWRTRAARTGSDCDVGEGTAGRPDFLRDRPPTFTEAPGARPAAGPTTPPTPRTPSRRRSPAAVLRPVSHPRSRRSGPSPSSSATRPRLPRRP
jgi:hypothetical protein